MYAHIEVKKLFLQLPPSRELIVALLTVDSASILANLTYRT